ncbi:MAG: 3-dehydroquinate synthase II [Promethearchaeota archaeon]
MKKIILKYDRKIPEEKFKGLFQAALNYGVFDIFTDERYIDRIGSMERIHVYSQLHDKKTNFLVLNEPSENELIGAIKDAASSNHLVGCSITVSSKEDEKRIIKLAKTHSDISFIIIKTTDWKVIPFENLIAELSTEDILLYADVDSINEAELLLQTLEKGVDGVIYRPLDVNEIIQLKTVSGSKINADLIEAEIVEIKNIPKADRVCVDTTSMLYPGEGMLVGSTAKGFALVHAEVFETEFVNSRPFRVNAGDVSAYILVPSFNEVGQLKTKTNYLSELKAGDSVLVSDVKGNLRIVTVGRVKIETRPMLLFKLTVKLEQGGKKKEIPINAILQNAETVRLVRDNLVPVSVVDLKLTDKVLVNLGPGATHFGTKIKETIIEK